MRGKGYGTIWRRVNGRITPAYAGKRRYAFQRREDRSDHPRVCGEKTKKIP